jgi:hypothetical protein
MALFRAKIENCATLIHGENVSPHCIAVEHAQRDERRKE